MPLSASRRGAAARAGSSRPYSKALAKPVRANAPIVAISSLRVIMVDLLESAQGLGDDVPADHHRVVLVGEVVAVHHVLAQEVAEPEQHPHRHPLSDDIDVL